MKITEWLATANILLLGVLIGLTLYRISHEQPIVIQNHIPACGVHRNG